MAKPISQAQQIVLAQALQQAVNCHQRGLLDEAAKLYAGILKIDAKNFDALHLMGVLEHQQGHSEEAAKLIRSALRIIPNSASALSNYAAVLLALGKHADARKNVDRAVKCDPLFADAWANRGEVAFAENQFDEVIANCDKATGLNPVHSGAMNTKGRALSQLARHNEALVCFKNALITQPGFASAHFNSGLIHLALGKAEKALDCFTKAVAIQPRNAKFLNGAGSALDRLRRYDEAALKYNAALAINPDFPDALSNRGSIYQKLNNHDDALADYSRALAISPAHVPALVNCGTLHHECGRYYEAIACYQKAISIDPRNADAHFNEALAHICLGNFLAGWQQYEWRWRKAHQRAEYSRFSQPRWLGEQSLDGKTILIHAEQGLGDTLHFVRYSESVAALGAQIILEVQPPLKSLIANMAGPLRVFAKGETLPDFDLHCPLLSLPHAMRTTRETIPATTPYLFTPNSYADKWKDRFSDSSELRVGLAWAGKATQNHDHNRSMPIEALLPLLQLNGVQFVSLQRDLRDGDACLLGSHSQIINLGDELNDFGDTAAVIDQLDLVISVDTSVAHLAGAMAKPVWVLLSYAGDWHWIMAGRDDSPWYPTATLFRQSRLGDWRGVVDDIGEALSQKIAPQSFSATLEKAARTP